MCDYKAYIFFFSEGNAQDTKIIIKLLTAYLQKRSIHYHFQHSIKYLKNISLKSCLIHPGSWCQCIFYSALFDFLAMEKKKNYINYIINRREYTQDRY